MSLSIGVGIFDQADDQEIKDDWEIWQDTVADLQKINMLLEARNLPAHKEPCPSPAVDNRSPNLDFPYRYIHYLRRFYSHIISNPQQLPPPVEDDQDPTEDSLIEEIASPKHHLLWHCDAEGYYVPVDFPIVIEDEDLPGGFLGSSHRLLAELLILAAPLGITLRHGELSDEQVKQLGSGQRPSNTNYNRRDPYSIECQVWLGLFESARLSIMHRAVIYFA